MKKFVTASISAIIGLSVLGASLSTPAYAGKKERRVAAGLAIGAVAGIIIAGELNRHSKKAHYRKKHRNGYRKDDRRIVNNYRHHRKQRWQRDRYYDDYDRYDGYDSYGYEYYPDRDFNDYNDDYRREPRVKKKPKRQATNNNRSHIQRCIKAYRSYDPQSDTYLGYDGKERICRK